MFYENKAVRFIEMGRDEYQAAFRVINGSENTFTRRLDWNTSKDCQWKLSFSFPTILLCSFPSLWLCSCLHFVISSFLQVPFSCNSWCLFFLFFLLCLCIACVIFLLQCCRVSIARWNKNKWAQGGKRYTKARLQYGLRRDTCTVDTNFVPTCPLKCELDTVRPYGQLLLALLCSEGMVGYCVHFCRTCILAFTYAVKYRIIYISRICKISQQ